MRKFLKILLGLAILGAIAVLAVLLLTSGEREVARNFVLNATNGDPVKARALLHEELQRQLPPDRFAAMFTDAAPYTNVSFASVETSGTGTTLTGTASTAGTCVSQVSFDILGDRIIRFNISPLCRK